MKNSTGKIIGIGGVFFKCDNPQALNAWYKDVLGMEPNDYGVLFEIKPFSGTPKYLQLGTFSDESKYFEPSKKGFMINFRVDDLDAFLSELKNKGVNTLGPIEVYDYGRFAHILDIEGNKIELWEPIDKSFAEDDGVTTPYI
jgi:predicted enzyme related to lactoylglutathione lyase